MNKMNTNLYTFSIYIIFHPATFPLHCQYYGCWWLIIVSYSEFNQIRKRFNV